MTNHWIDLQNCKTILVEGSNVAENHPMAFKWIRKAQENGAKIIHVDPRFTRTSAAADVYARIRPGTDAAFQNTMINHILVNNLYDEDYVVTHTNALFLGDEAFDFKDGVFSGFDAENHKYHTETWGYQLDARGKPRVAKSLDDPHCVFSRLKTFVSRYTLERGEQITGIPAEQIRQIAEMMAKNRPGSILYALGMTQHTTGLQGIRSSVNTISHVEQIVRTYLSPSFGNEIAADIKALDIQRWLKSLHDSNSLAWTTISKMRGVMRRIYKIGILHEHVATNPVLHAAPRSKTDSSS